VFSAALFTAASGIATRDVKIAAHTVGRAYSRTGRAALPRGRLTASTILFGKKNAHCHSEFLGKMLDLILELLFPRKQYGTRCTTTLGVTVRSRAEHQIAEYFDSIRLRYQYEKELEAKFWIFREKISAPDFYLPDYDVYVEYWGMLDVDNNYERKKYERSMKYKMARYHQLGVKFISIYPNNMKSLDWNFRTKFKKVAGVDLPR